MQDIGGFSHLHHKGRAAAGQVIRRADAGKDAIDRPDLHLLRRDVAADIGQQRNQRGLAHIGTFTAHVRPGDDQHPPLRRQLQRVGDKRLFQHLLDHRMAAFADANARLIAKGRAAVVQGFRAFRQVDQHVQLGQRACARLQVGKMRQQQVEQFVIKLFFQRQRLALGGQHLIFVFLQLRNNVAFGVFQRLATHVVDRRQVALAAADLDIVAVDGVVADLQGIEAQPLALADLQLIEIISGAIGQRPPLVQLFAVARGDNPAVADQHRRRVDHRALQQFAQFAKLAHFLAQFLHRLTVNVGQLLAQQRQLLQGMTHAG